MCGNRSKITFSKVVPLNFEVGTYTIFKSRGRTTLLWLGKGASQKDF